MGLLNKFIKKDSHHKSESKSEKKSEHTLKEDILISSDWVVKALNSSGYKADYSLESMKEIDRFFDEQNTETGILSKNRGSILFALGSYVGETAIKLFGGEWITDDNDPKGEVNITVKLSNGTMIFPVIKCMKRFSNGSEDSLYAYLYVIERFPGGEGQ